MKNEITILKQIRQQLAHCMAFYGDEPDELMHKLETLVIEWYEKGLQADKDKPFNYTLNYPDAS
jgi:hypothetical protein